MKLLQLWRQCAARTALEPPHVHPPQGGYGGTVRLQVLLPALPLPDAMTHATVEEAGSWAASVRRWCDHEPALTGLCLVRAQHRQAGLAPRQPVFYRVEFEVESLLKGSHPLPGNDAKVRELFGEWFRVWFAVSFFRLDHSFRGGDFFKGGRLPQAHGPAARAG